ncbi:unnamed protein product [Rhizoctonia solani]|uniref:Uncharacterized protein n=1 Tax=Rhizoctonia solani TaxID=456999 RepID=A0A8H3BML7_9AGAM|nr:unnamed protein product [Rhizoctonia solani]CAE6459627.1 unnamed protein product [Rhizoctonia solani]
MPKTSKEKSTSKDNPGQATTGDGSKSRGERESERHKSSNFELDPITLSQRQKDYLLPLFPDYTLAKANKGTRKGMNGKKFVEGMIEEFLVKFRIFQGSEGEKKKKALEDCYTEKIYNWFNNNKKGVRAELTDLLSTTSAENLWYYEFPSITSNAVQEYLNNHKAEKFSLGLFRRIQHEQYLEVDERIRQSYAAKAREHNDQVRAAGPLTGEPHQVYVKEYASRLSKAIEDGFTKCGILTTVHFMHEAPPESWVDNKKHMTVSSLTTNEIEDYLEVQDHDDSSRAFTTWVHETYFNQKQSVKAQVVRPSVYPDRQAESLPLVPVLGPDPRISIVRDIYHDYFTAMWAYGGGQTSVPWSLIIEDIAQGGEEWIRRSCLPNPKDAPLVLPSRLTLRHGLKWVEHFEKRQKGAPLGEQLQFAQTFALKPPPTTSSALRPCPTNKYRANTVYTLRFTEPIQRSEAVTGIPYLPRAWHWLRSLTGGSPSFNNGLKLPTAEVVMEDPVILPAEVTSWKDLFGNSWGKVEEVVDALVACANEAESLGPHSPPDGIWATIEDVESCSGSRLPLPAHLPQRPPSDVTTRDYFVIFWFPADFYQPPFKSRNNATIDFIEQYMEEGLPQSSVFHHPSQTIVGGKCGGAWLIRGHVLLLANIAASTRLIEPPVPAPESYELERLTDTHWKRAISWGQSLLAKYQKSNDILRQSLPERIRPPQPEPGCAPSAGDSPTTEEFEEGSRESKGSAKGATRKQPKRKIKRPLQLGTSYVADGARSLGSDDSERWSGSDSDNFKPIEREESSEDDIEAEGSATSDPKGKRPERSARKSRSRGKSRGASKERRRKPKLFEGLVDDVSERPNEDPSPCAVAEQSTPPMEEGTNLQFNDITQGSSVPVDPSVVTPPESADNHTNLPTNSNAPRLEAQRLSITASGSAALVCFPHGVPLKFSDIEPHTSLHIFGPFGTPKNYDAQGLLSMDIRSLMERTSEFCAGFDNAIAQWDNYLEGYESGYTDAAWNKAALLTRSLIRTTESKACLEVVLVHRAALQKARQGWPDMRAQHLRLLNLFREGCLFQLAFSQANFVGINDRPEEKDKLVITTRELLGALHALRYELTTVQAYERVASIWYAKLQLLLDFEHIKDAPDNAILTLARGVAAWWRDGRDFLEVVREERNRMWALPMNKKTTDKGGYLPSRLKVDRYYKYSFGCPESGWMGKYCEILQTQVLEKMLPPAAQLEGHVVLCIDSEAVPAPGVPLQEESSDIPEKAQ